MNAVIVVPCYNEASRLTPNPFLAFLESSPGTRILFVNDGSTDSTQALLEALANRAPKQIFLLPLPRNRGKAEAVRLGLLWGIQQGAPTVGFLDADLAAPLDCLTQMHTILQREQKDIVMGARVALLGRRIDRNGLRHYAGRIFATAASLTLGLTVYDTQCGAKLFRVTDHLRKVIAAPFRTRWIFDVEILARFILLERQGGPRLREICLEHPLQEWIDRKGSKLRLKDFFISIADLASIALLLQRNILPVPGPHDNLASSPTPLKECSS